MRCWGDNDNAQLGNGTLTNSKTPVAVTGLNGVLSISAGGYHACAMGATVVRCWGRNVEGQIGAGTSVSGRYSKTPAMVIELVQGGHAVAITAGGYHSCAILTSRGVRCWGEGIHGQLGQHHLQSSSFPVTAKGLTGVVQVSGGGFHTCAVVRGQRALCWGLSIYGQTGYGGVAPPDVPFGVSGLTGARSVSTGQFHTCAVRTNNTTVCWGRNNDGQLGNGTLKTALTPVAVKGA